MLDPQHVTEAPKIADQLFRDALGNHVKMYTESRLAAAHVNIDLRVGRVVFQAPDVEVANTTGLVECCLLYTSLWDVCALAGRLRFCPHL